LESVSTISKLEIPIDKVFYSKKSKILSVDLFGFVFVGHYKKSAKISEILDDIFASLKEIKFDRSSIYLLDYNQMNENRILIEISKIIDGISEEKIMEYSQYYPESNRDLLIKSIDKFISIPT